MHSIGRSTALALLAAAAALAATATATASAPSCTLVSPAVIHSSLGVTVGPLRQIPGHNSLTCSYSVNGVPDAVKVTWKSGVSTAAFNATTASASHAFPHAHNVSGNGYTIWWTTIGSGPYGSTMLFLHKGESELDVTAIASYAKVARLAHRLLPTLA